MTSKTHGPHRRKDKSEYQECTCKMDKSLNRGMFNKFESRKICVAGYQCDNSDFDFCIAEHNELPVIKICSDEGRDDCQQLKPKGTEASFGTTVITVPILFIISILFSRVTVNVLVFVLRVVFFHLIVYIGTRYMYDAVCRDFAILGDPGADSGDKRKPKRAEKYGTKKSKERREEPLGTMSYQTSSKRSPPFWLLIGARKTSDWAEKHKSFLAPIRSQNGGDCLELVW